MTILEAKNVSKLYEVRGIETRALHEVSLAVGAGEFTALAGPSGSGKTTLLNLFGALDAPSSGTVEIDGHISRSSRARNSPRCGSRSWASCFRRST